MNLKDEGAKLEAMLREETEKAQTSTQRIIALRGALEYNNYLINLQNEPALDAVKEEKS